MMNGMMSLFENTLWHEQVCVEGQGYEMTMKGARVDNVNWHNKVI